MKKLIACSIAGLLFTHALADDAQIVPIMGAGATSCGKYLGASVKGLTATKAFYLAWAQGYLTAMNRVLVSQSFKPLRTVEPGQITAYLQKYCRGNPLDLMHAGVQHLAGELIQH